MKNKVHIMILSAGSLLSQNIHDALDHRRENVYITGLNSDYKNARLFRCDQVFISPLLEDPNFENFVLDKIDELQPDIVFAGRDHDSLFLARLVEKYPYLINKIVTGSSKTVELMNDKAKSYEFALKHNLPFAKSFILKSKDIVEAKKWANECGYPFLAKPREGFGSLGIRIISNDDELKAFINANETSEYMLQEILELDNHSLEMIQNFRNTINTGVPFHFHIPVKDQYAAQAFINPKGEIEGLFTAVSLMVIGRCEGAELVEDEAFTKVAKAYAKAIRDEGCRGFYNLQLRKVGDTYVAHEMNGRMSGSTSARRYLGYDEVRMAIKSWTGKDIGNGVTKSSQQDGIVLRSITDYFAPTKGMNELKNTGKWTREE